MLHFAALFDDVDLRFHLIINRLLQKAERIEVFNLAAGAEFGLPFGAHRHIGIHAERALGHIAVANIQPRDQAVQRFGISHRLGRRAHFRLGNHFQQRRAGAVQINARRAV